jgi:hypothetical protein
MSLYPETIHVIVRADSDIQSIGDLAGKRVSTGDVGSGVEANALQVLGVHGISFSDINRVSLPFGGSADAMRDGQLDAFFVTSAAPNSAVLELATNNALRILPIAQDKIDELMNTYKFYRPIEVTADHYGFLSQAVPTVAVQATLVASTDMSDAAAYHIVKSILENASQIAHIRGAYITPANAILYTSIPFHPGAEAYFKEIGVLN